MTWWEVLVQQTINGLTRGAVFALIALGYTMVYGIIELINFAHGDVFMVGAFASMFVLTSILGQDGSAASVPQAIFLLVTTFVIVMVVIGLLGVAIERFAYRPLRNAPRLAPLITAIGVSFILQNLVQGIPPYFGFGPFNTNSPQIFPTDAFITIGDARIPVLSLFIIATALSMMASLQLFVGRTRIGRA